jgi:alkylation response protein AidB-like acyl-CoA dehydrogenase
MQFSFSDEQEAFREVLRRFFEDKSSTADVRRLMASDEGYDSAVWRQMSDDLGLPGITIPEAYGGQGFGFVELCVAMEEMGRALLCAPFLSSAVMASHAILNGASEQAKRDLLPGIASGETRAALAITEPNGQWELGGVQMIASGEGEGVRLNGAKSFVVDGHTADVLIVAARGENAQGSQGLSLFHVAADAKGLTRTLLTTVDPTRKLAKLDFNDVSAQRIGEGENVGAALERTMAQTHIALANEMMGGADRLRESAVDYVNLRVQFGRQVSSFQAIKHKCADMLLEVELAKSAAYTAAESAADESADMLALASLAKAAAADAYMQTAATTIQLHGGIGFTWDNDTHLWFKRAKSSEVLFGDATYHREQLMQHWNV